MFLVCSKMEITESRGQVVWECESPVGNVA